MKGKEMGYKITDLKPTWADYNYKMLLPNAGSKTVEFKNGTAKTNDDVVANYFRKNPLQYIVETE